MAENDKKSPTKNRDKDFLSDDLFLYWRTNPTRELNEYWKRFSRRHPSLDHDFHQAITELDEILATSHQLTQSQLEVRERIEKSLRAYRFRRKKLIYYCSAAAATLLLVIGSALFFMTDRNNIVEPQEKLLTLGSISSENEIQLLMSDGNHMNLHNNSTINLSEEGSSLIIRDSVSQRKIKIEEQTTNKLITPYGKRSSLILADGSKVWLNSGTEIEFPSVFSDKGREIRISGEIFIDVAKQGKPFLIHTLHSQIEVFGTSFNVSAYEEERRESVVLVEGSVKVKSNTGNTSVVLSPNQMAEIEDGRIKSKTVDVSEYISWKNGFIRFNKTPIDEVLRKVARYYNVEFRYNENLLLNTKTCSGNLFLSDDIKDVLKAFTDITLLNYEKTDDKTIHVKN